MVGLPRPQHPRQDGARRLHAAGRLLRVARRAAIAAVLGCLLLVAIYVARGGRSAEPLPGPPLRALGAQRGIVVGTAVRGDVQRRNRAYRQLIAAQFSSVTPENEMKWDAIEPAPGEFQFGPANGIVDRAKQASQQVRGHTLVWHAQLPRWVRELDGPQLRTALDRHIRGVMGHYGRDVPVWDVVNEPLTDDGRLRPSVFGRRLGRDYIADAFRIAHEAQPDAALYVNEIGADGINEKSDALYALVRDLRAQGVPIDGVGFQAHVNLRGLPDSFVANLRRFRELGVDVAITEADVGLRMPASDRGLAAQARIYAQIVDGCLAVGCRSVTFWGYTDGRSWISETQAGMGAATLLNPQLRPKPAFFAVQRALAGWTGGQGAGGAQPHW